MVTKLEFYIGKNYWTFGFTFSVLMVQITNKLSVLRRNVLHVIISSNMKGWRW